MNVEQLVAQMGSVVCSIHYEAGLSEAMQILDDNQLEVLLVVDDDHSIEGIISKSDIVSSHNISHNWVQPPLSIKDIMTPQEKQTVARKDDEIRTVLAMMEEQNLQHLPILDQGKVFALISLDDVITAFATDTVNTMVSNFINRKKLS